VIKLITKEKKSKIGKTSRAAGKRFELKVRKDLEGKGWIVCKWTNTVEFDENDEGRLIQAKSKYNPFLGRTISEGSGFPDYICFRHGAHDLFEIIGVESKMSKYLDAKEKKICFWLLNNKIFNEIRIAHSEIEGRRTNIVYNKYEP
jgi:hypothetical protein